MARKPSDEIHIPDVEFQRKHDIICQERQYQLITPLYGGGAETNQADPISVVRGTEVRGHLRFWWRATQLGRFSSLSELRKAEEQLWGSSEAPSLVKIAIRDFFYENEEHAYEVKKIGGKLKIVQSKKVAAYAAFPLQPDKEQSKDSTWKSAKVLIGVKFTLILEFPEINKKEILDSLWAWETFGGIGARTRRGFGALFCVDNDVISREQFVTWLRKGLEKHVTEVINPIEGVPYLSKALIKYAYLASDKEPIQSWIHIIGLLQKFRQENARYKNKYGLSQWPEANAIRHIFEKELKFPDDGESHQLIKKFPRAKFGLPINFHLPHDKEIPDDLVLLGKQVEGDKWIDRMASPLILRPLKCVEGSIGLAAVLQWHHQNSDESYTPPGGLRLKGAPENPEVKSDLDKNEALKLPMLKQTDVLAKFLGFIKSNGGRK